MSDELSPEEVAIMIRARQLLRKKGLAADADVTEICKAAGVSRKTGYQWAEKYDSKRAEAKSQSIEQRLKKLQADHEKLQKAYEWESVKNRGFELAWEIHGVDEWLASKKNTSRHHSGKKR